VTSAKKIAANRANARKSRGPNSEAGKRAASCNALRHGLSALSHRDPAIVAEIELMAKAICGDDTNPLLLDQAVVIAENEVLLRSVRMQKLAVIERLYDPWICSLSKGPRRILAMARLRFRQDKIAYDEFSQLVTKLRKRGEKFFTIFEPREVKPDEPVVRYEAIKDRDEHDALQEALPDLVRLLRYERRAWSRRKRAIRLFVAIKLTSRQGHLRSQ
jgi:hypothetical protein